MTPRFNRWKKRMASIALAGALVFSGVSSANATTFPDVSDRYKEVVDYLVDNYLIIGFPDRFGTHEAVKRVDAVVILAKVLELDEVDAPAASFTDVPSRAQGAISALAAAGIINGKSETRFGAEDPLTRGEMALILQRAYQLEAASDTLKFTDVSDRYEEAVAALVDNHITLGKTPVQFGTKDSITRGELAIFIYRLKDHKTF
ncbi:S-layer homology domain-containing protein [Bacillus thermotolerans]|uniref:S-layer homology domain-containing protein n=1 Tax=Bacillus thermotolerans TaxID=1221996 RepID=UPI000591F873|nr:S-layer homology domain-containing protein [Bacillus thermotolerans]KKB44977.1 Transporter [Bacillus thermotolerans]